MGRNNPRISAGASGLGSKVSCWGGPPCSHRKMTVFARPKVAAFSRPRAAWGLGSRSDLGGGVRLGVEGLVLGRSTLQPQENDVFRPAEGGGFLPAQRRLGARLQIGPRRGRPAWGRRSRAGAVHLAATGK